MKNILLILITLILCSCSKNNTSTKNSEIPGIWFDRGIQCANEIKDSSFDLNLLPKTIESDIAKYLDLENGAPHFSENVDPNNLKYIGEYKACTKTIKIWEYPCTELPNCYAGIMPWAQTYLTTTVVPDFEL